MIASILFVALVILLVFAPEIIRGIKKVRLAEMGLNANKKWLAAQHALNEFLDRWPDIRHPEAQKLLEEEIAAYEEWIRASPSAKNQETHLLFLKGLRAKNKSFLRCVK